MVKIYTKTGDSGTTGIWGGERLPKNSTLIEANGVVDECNSIIGVIKSQLSEEDLIKSLTHIQNTLIIVGSDLTNLKRDPKLPKVTKDDVNFLEQQIDDFDQELPTLKQFILPSGTYAASLSHLGRSVCRRAERSIVQLINEHNEMPEILVSYFNRLSDYLFNLARVINHRSGVQEDIWTNPKV